MNPDPLTKVNRQDDEREYEKYIEDDSDPTPAVAEENPQEASPYVVRTEQERDALRRRGLLPMLRRSELGQLPEARWLIKGVTPARCLGGLIGPPKEGKTFNILAQACSVVSGTPFYGHDVEESGPVIYVAGEGGAGLRSRIEAWEAAHPLANTDNLIVVPKMVHARNDQEVERLRRTIAVEGPKLVIFDTLARFLSGMDENSAKDMGHAVEIAEAIRDENDVTSFFLHHTTKNGEDPRGSGAFFGAVDFMQKQRRDDADGSITMACGGMKDSPDFKPMRFTLKPVLESAILEQLPTILAPTSTSSSPFGGSARRF